MNSASSLRGHVAGAGAGLKEAVEGESAGIGGGVL